MISDKYIAVKVYWCKLHVSVYYDFIEIYFIPLFYLDLLSCELAEQNCFPILNFFWLL